MNETKPTIRPFAPGDLERLQEIRQAAFEPIFRSFRQIVGPSIATVAFARAEEEQAELLASICAPDSKHHVWTLLLGEEIVGFVSFTVDEATRVGEIGLNAVHPEHAGRGIGSHAFELVLQRMKELGAEVATVGTGADASHAPARQAYEKVGFGPAIPSIYLYKRL